MIAVAPLIFSLASALVVAALSQRKEAKYLSVFLSALHLLLVSFIAASIYENGALALQMGGWKAPFGISFFVDELSAIMLWISSFLAFGIHLYSLGANDERENRSGFHFLLHFLMVGICGAFSTNDLFNLYVWFEVLLLSSFALMASSTERRALSGSIIYVIINLFGSALFLFSLGLLYNSTGTLNFADLLRLKEQGVLSSTVHTVATLLFVAFTLKAGVIPFAQWLPAAYPVAGISALSLFAGVLTKIGTYCLLRFVSAGLSSETSTLMPLLTGLSLITMLIGVLGAASSKGLRQILSYHCVSQVGYMTLAVSFGTANALAAAVFYMVHHMFVKSSLFLFTGWLEKKYGSSKLQDLGYLSRRGLLIIVFALPALSLAGIPPLSGFWAKLLILHEALALEAYISALFILLVGLLTLFSMSKIWSEAFQKSNEKLAKAREISRFESWSMGLPLAIFCLWILILGIFPKPFLSLAERAAVRLLNPVHTIESVIGSPVEGSNQ